MNMAEKVLFIEALFNKVKVEVFLEVGTMPEEWDDIEIRDLIAEKFDKQRMRDHFNRLVPTLRQEGHP